MAGLSLSACGSLNLNLVNSMGSNLSNHISHSASWRVGPGSVGELVPGNPIPESVYEREGRSFEQLWSDRVVDLNEMDVYAKGFRDQSGDTVVNFPNLDVRVSIDPDEVVTGVWVGGSVRTAKGAGVGSAKSELENAHGSMQGNGLPAPYLCVLHTKALPGVMFYFRDDCQHLEDDSVVVKVQVVGAG